MIFQKIIRMPYDFLNNINYTIDYVYYITVSHHLKLHMLKIQIFHILKNMIVSNLTRDAE